MLARRDLCNDIDIDEVLCAYAAYLVHAGESTPARNARSVTRWRFLAGAVATRSRYP
jgi:hypothetical protein